MAEQPEHRRDLTSLYWLVGLALGALLGGLAGWLLVA